MSGSAVHEGRLKELPDADLRATAVGLLASFSKLHFWPDCTEALLVHADLKPGAFQGGDRAVIDEAAARVRLVFSLAACLRCFAARGMLGRSGVRTWAAAIAARSARFAPKRRDSERATHPPKQRAKKTRRPQVRAAAGGSLPWLDGGWKDWEHFHGRPFGSYNLWVARDELFGKYYSPASAKAAAPAATEAAN